MESPKTIPVPPSNNIAGLIGAVVDKSLELTTEIIAANGPIAFATSFEPWAKAIAHAVTIIKIPNAYSIPPLDEILSLFSLNAKDVTPPVNKDINAVKNQISLSLQERPICDKPFLAIT